MIHETIKKILKDVEEPTIFEVGARQGEDSEIFIRNFPKGEFFLFEPLPSNYQRLCERINEQKFDCLDRVYFCDIALSDKTGYAEFYVSSDSAGFNGSSSLLKPKEHIEAFPHVKFNETINVRTYSLDEFCFDTKVVRIDLLWLDTQGSESQIIEGGQNTLRNTKFLYSEHYYNEMYEGQIPFSEWFKKLPGKWSIVQMYPNDVLLRNENLNGSSKI